MEDSSGSAGAERLDVVAENGVPQCASEFTGGALVSDKELDCSGLIEDWNSLGSEPPNKRAITNAANVVRYLDEQGSRSRRMEASAEGGVCISFFSGDKYAAIECFNTGDTLAVTSIGDDVTVWEIESELELANSIVRIQAFLDETLTNEIEQRIITSLEEFDSGNMRGYNWCPMCERLTEHLIYWFARECLECGEPTEITPAPESPA